ncbi:MAG: ABC transporter permease [Alphaproteobacteria bacterium]|nr:ABC transporter permease [Alphaproteobacteria bacterium]
MPPQQPAPVRFERDANWLGLYTLIEKEIGRFIKVHTQTITAPVMTALLYYLIFAVALGGDLRTMGDVGYLQFLAPGLIMMSVAQNAFANTSSSLVISKIQGNIVDLLMPPLSPGELITGFAVGGIARGIVVGTVSAITMAILVDLPLHSIAAVLFYGVMGSLMLALLGVVGGIWADKFDHLAAIQNFIIMPATFLSGTFYSIDRMPQDWHFILHLNPFFYMIDGFRYGFIGVSDGTLGTGAAVLTGVNLILLGISYGMLRTGYKLKA